MEKTVIKGFTRRHRMLPPPAKNDEYETCVLCGKKTNVKRTTHIDLRDCYVEGCGQLCYDCWRDTVYVK